MFMSLIPLPYRILVVAILAAVWSGFLFYGGWHECSVREQAKQRDQAIAYAHQVKAEQARGDQIALDLATEKDRQKIVYRTITKEVKTYVSALADSKCIVPAGFVSLHDAAAAGRLPEGTLNPTDSPSGVVLSAVADTVTDNYATCNEIRSQLNALIDWETGKKPR